MDDWDDLLRRAAAAQRLAFERLLADLGLTPAQFAVLRIVAQCPGVSAAEAARLERLTAPTMSVIVANLERKGALARRARPENARIQELKPTDLGLKLVAEGWERVRVWRERAARSLQRELAPEISRWLRQVAEIDV